MRYVGLVLIILGTALCIDQTFGLLPAVRDHELERASQIGRSMVMPLLWFCIGVLMRTHAGARAAATVSEPKKRG